MNYGLKLKLFRKRAGLTLKEVSEVTGISVASLSSYENREKSIPVSVLIKLSNLYMFDVFDVLGVRAKYDDCGDEYIEMDLNPYYLIRAHCENVLEKEMRSEKLFGNEPMPNEYYNMRFEELIEDTINSSFFGKKYSDTIRSEKPNPDLYFK